MTTQLHPRPGPTGPAAVQTPGSGQARKSTRTREVQYVGP
jgi:hypothetical protein